MPTILTHTAVPLSLGVGLGDSVISKRLLVAGVVASTLPDLDVLGFRLGVPYSAEWGHRGFSHSLVFALMIALVGVGLAKRLGATRKTVFWFLLITVASHGFLDAFTNGVLGIAFLWPFSHARYFAPFHPIQVSPLSLSGIFSARGVAVLRSEFLWVWMPCIVATALAVASRSRAPSTRATGRG